MIELCKLIVRHKVGIALTDPMPPLGGGTTGRPHGAAPTKGITRNKEIAKQGNWALPYFTALWKALAAASALGPM